jgi:hypothetical protein
MKKKYQSKILQAIHEDAKGMHKLGIISDERMCYYDRECLVQELEPIYETTNSQSHSAGTRHNVRISAKGAGS